MPAGEANSGKSNCADLLEIMACCCYLVAFHAGREKKDANYLCYTSLFALLARNVLRVDSLTIVPMVLEIGWQNNPAMFVLTRCFAIKLR